MLLNLTEAKQYLRIEEAYTEEDDLLQLMIDNAIFYIEDAVGSIPEDNIKVQKKAKLLALLLLSDFYENRALIKEGNEEVRYTVQNMLTQLSTYLSTGVVGETA